MLQFSTQDHLIFLLPRCHHVHDRASIQKTYARRPFLAKRFSLARKLSVSNRSSKLSKAHGYWSIAFCLPKIDTSDMSPQPLRGKRLSEMNYRSRLFGGITINGRTIVGPLVAFTMAGLLFVYARSSIRAAKRNAERHRIADGGQISW